ncbi:hypothetical protein H5410_040681 [Solanum commersonii]|uniref:Uncharacterized protein n=1 Tax=Solanum commersonii TaxID=4109 RepID=A0A9J5XRL1_SOLCO|nr:hypothetical protein H5410_040681 [Solanum commersonii]
MGKGSWDVTALQVEINCWSSAFGFATSLLGKPKTHGWVALYLPLQNLYITPQPLDCAAEDCSVTLVEIADELDDPPFGQLIAFSVLPFASSHFGSLGGTVLLCETNRRPADCSFPRLLIHFLQGFAY